jgi:hypothetical protein
MKRKLGRPRIIAGGVRVAVFLSADQAAWLREQPRGKSETVRQLIDRERRETSGDWVCGWEPADWSIHKMDSA